MPRPTSVTTIWSGGQTGVDRAGLDAGLVLRLEVGGYCPAGRRAEDGPIPERYPVTEHPSPDYPPRTRRNVWETDATLLVTGAIVEGGSMLTARLAREAGRPLLILSNLRSRKSPVEVAREVRIWLGRTWVRTEHPTGNMQHQPRRLNIAGNRESVSPGIHLATFRVLMLALAPGLRERVPSCPTCDGDGWTSWHGWSGPERDGCPLSCEGTSVREWPPKWVTR